MIKKGGNSIEEINYSNVFGTYDRWFVDKQRETLTGFYNTVLNTKENQHKSVICVGDYFEHLYNDNCQYCVGKCNGKSHGTHKYSLNCKRKECSLVCYGRRNNRVQNTKCLSCCSCRCNCGDPNCRYKVNINSCSCVCLDSCNNIELSLFMSETGKKDETMIRTAVRSIMEELNLEISSQFNLFKNVAYVEIDKSTKFRNKIEIIGGDNTYDKVNIVIFGEDLILRKLFGKLYRDKSYLPDDLIGCLAIIPIVKLPELFPYLVKH